MSDLDDIGESARQMGVDALCLVETNLDTRARNVVENCKWKLRQYFDKSKMAISSTLSGPIKSQYLPGGTMTVIGHKWCDRTTVEAEQGALGRWTEATITGKANKKVTIMTVYRVVAGDEGRNGADTAYVLDDLTTRIEALREAGHEIIVALDANDTLQKENEFTKWTRKLRLIDVLVRRHGNEDEPATYARGRHRIDYVLTTHRIAEYITAAGILPLKDFCLSDHRAIFVDVDIKGYLQGAPSDANAREQRGIQSRNPKAVKIYRNELEEWLETSRIEERMDEFEESLTATTPPNTQAIHRALDVFDEEITQAKLAAEQKCMEKCRHAWSPALQEARMKYNYWRLWVSELNTGKDYSHYRNTLHLEHHPPPIDIKHATTQERIAHQEFKAIARQDEHHRANYLEKQRQEAIKDGKVKDAKAIARVIRAEQRSKIFRRLKNIRGANKSGAITHILVPDEDTGEWETIQDKETMERIMIERNRQHFGQAAGTPFTQPHMRELLGPYGTSEFSQGILDGSVDIEAIDTTEAAKTLLKAMQQVHHGELIEWKVTMEEVKQGYRIWRESTSTSPSGLHLGHDKAILKSEQLDIAEGKTITLADRMFSMKAKMLNWATYYGHVYDRWKTILNFMLEKIPGKPTINKLRVIHLIESDLNFLVGTIWGRRLMWQCEELGVLGDEQSGSRKNRKAQDVLLFKHMVYSIMRMTRTGGGTFDNDAKSCYDRIVMNFAALCAQRVGMDPKACELFLKVLEAVKYKIKTHLGTSTDGYGNEEHHQIHGPGQGGKASPAIWILECCLAMECMNRKTSGAWFTDPYKQRAVQQNMTGFVDDTTIWINNFLRDLKGPTDIPHLLQQMGIAAQWWEELLYALGGKLELDKCFYYVTGWTFDEEGVPSLTALPREQITIIDSGTGTTTPIRAQESTIPHVTLGTMEGPSGNYTAERKRLMDKSRAFAQRVSTAVVNIEEASILYHNMYLPSMSYSLVTGTLTTKDATAIQGPAKKAIINAMGYAGTTPHAVIYGSRELGGIGMQDLFNEQGTVKTMMLLQQLRMGQNLGDASFIAIQWAQKFSGITKPILEEVYSDIPHLRGEKWFTTLREFLAQSHLGIRIKDLILPDLARTHDKTLMELTKDFTLGEIDCINRCRIYLQVETISDISNAKGDTIREAIWECTRTHDDHQDLWPYQPRPGKQHRNIWKRFMKSLTTETSVLRQPLGKWLPQHRRKDWPAYYIPKWNCVIRKQGNTWWQHQITGHDRRGSFLATRQEPPRDWDRQYCIPADCTILRDKQHAQWGQFDAPTPPTQVDAVANTWDEYITRIPNWERPLAQVNFIEDQDVIEAILSDWNQQVYIVSDGGCQGNIGSYGWIMATEDRVLCEGQGKAWGQPMSSYRAEGIGKLAWLVFLRHYTTYSGVIINCAIKQYCDNKALIGNTKFEERYDPSIFVTAADYDVVHSIREEQFRLRRNAIRLRQGKHIKGHQDKGIKDVSTLSWPAQLNIRADELATNTLQTMDSTYQRQVELPKCAAYLLNDGKVVSSGEKKTLRWKRAELRLQAYYNGKFEWSPSTIDKVNWAARRIALQTQKLGGRVFTTKWLIGWLATGTRKSKYGDDITSCVLCNEVEDNDHLFLCRCRRQANDQLLEDFQDHLKEIKTIPDVAAALLEGLQRWLRQKPGKRFGEDTMRICVAEQQEIGWGNLLKGLLGQEWCRHQEHRSEHKPLGDSWGAKVVSFLVNAAHQRWLDRNNRVHKKAEGHWTTWIERETWAWIEKLYAMADKVGYQNTHIFAIPLEQRRNQTIRGLRAWATRWEPVILRLVTEEQNRTTAGMRDIREIFRNMVIRTNNGRRSGSNTRDTVTTTTEDHATRDQDEATAQETPPQLVPEDRLRHDGRQKVWAPDKDKQFTQPTTSPSTTETPTTTTNSQQMETRQTFIHRQAIKAGNAIKRKSIQWGITKWFQPRPINEEHTNITNQLGGQNHATTHNCNNRGNGEHTHSLSWHTE